MPIYEYNGKRYNIPEDKIEELVTRMPGAKLIEHNAPDREITETVQQHEQQPVQQSSGQQEISLDTPKLTTSSFNQEMAKQSQSPSNYISLGQDQGGIADINRTVVYPQYKQERDDKRALKNDLAALGADIQSKIDERVKQLDEKWAKEDEGKSTARKVLERPNPYTGFVNDRGDRVHDNYLTAKKHIDEANLLIENVESGAKALKGIKDEVFDPNTWLLGLDEIGKNSNVKEVVRKYENKEKLTDDEDAVLDALALNMAANAFYASDLPRQYKWGQIAGESLPFMMEFLLNPIAGGGKGIAKTIAKRALSRFALGKGARTAIKAGSRILGDAVGAAGMTLTTGAPRTIADAMNRNLGEATFARGETGAFEYTGHEGGVDPVRAGLESFMASTIEYGSEMAGSAGVGKLLKKTIPMPKFVSSAMGNLKASGIGRAYKGITNSNAYKEVRRVLKKGQWNGTVGEYGEELYGTAMNAIFVGDNKLSDLVDIDQQVDTFMGLSITGGVTGSVSTVAYVADRARTSYKLSKADETGSKYFQDWEQIKDQLADYSIGELADAQKDVLANKDIPKEGRRALSDYIYYSTYQQALIGANEQRHEDNKAYAKTENAKRLRESISNKQSVVLPTLNKEIEQLEAELGDLVDLTYAEMANSPESTPELLEAKRNHEIASAEYEGVIESLKTEVDEFIAPQIKAIEDIAVDGQITELNVGTEDAPDIVYLVKGDIAINEDGTIDIDATSPMLTVKNSEGKKRMIARSKIATAQQDNLGATVEAIRQQAYEKFVRPLADKMEDKTHFQNGEQVEYVNAKGETVAGTVVNKQNNTVTVVSVDGKKTETLTENQLASQLITESIDDVKVRDVIQVEIDGEIYDANVISIQDGKVELYIPSFPEASGRYQDVTAEELRKIRVVPQAETIKKTEEEAKSEGSVPEQVEQNDSKTPEAEAESQLTPEAEAEAEKQLFLFSLPVVQSGKRKGQIDQSQMTPDQNIKYFEYQYGQDKAIEASQKMVQILNNKIASELKKLDNDPFNIELNENIQAMQSQLQAYKAYADAQQQQGSQQQQEQEQQGQEQQQQKQEQRQQEQEQRQQEQEVEQRDEQQVGPLFDQIENIDQQEVHKINAEETEKISKIFASVSNLVPVDRQLWAKTTISRRQANEILKDIREFQDAAIENGTIEYKEHLDRHNYEIVDGKEIKINTYKLNGYTIEIGYEGGSSTHGASGFYTQVENPQGEILKIYDPKYRTEKTNDISYQHPRFIEQQEQQEQQQQQPQEQPQGVQIEKEQKLTPEEKAKLRREQKERLAKQKKELRAQRRAEAKALAEEERLRIEKEIEAEQNDPNLSKAEKEIRMLMRQADAEKEELRNKFRNAKPSERESLWGDVQSLREHIMRELIKGQKILWGDSNGSKGFAYHLGLKGSETERRKYIGLLGSAQKTNAKTPEQFAHDIWEDVASSETDQFFGVDTMEILDEVLDVLYTHTSKGQMIKALNSARLDDAFAQIDSEVNMAINYLESMQDESPIDDEELNEWEEASSDISDEEYDLYYKNQIEYEEFEEQIRNFKENFDDNGYEEEFGSDREVVEQGSETPIGEGRDQSMLSSEEDQGESHKAPESQAEGRVESSEAVRDREDDQSGESKNAQGPIGRAEENLDAENERRVEGKEDAPIDIVQEAKDAVEKDKTSKLPKTEQQPVKDVIDGYSEQDIKDMVDYHIKQVADDYDVDIEVVDMAIVGSRNRGDARIDSDLDVVVEYKADLSEDALFNMLNGVGLSIEGVQVDINPIKESKTGTLQEYMKKSEAYDREVANRKKEESERVKPISIVEKAQQAVEKHKQESYKKEASRLSEMFGVDVEMHENLDGVNKDVRKQIESGGRTPGWYQNGKVHIYLPHTISVKDLQETFFHEVIAHKGLRELLGDRFNDVMLDFFDKLPKEVQAQLLSRYKSFDVYANKTDQELKVIAADEFIASVAENGEFMGVDQRTVLQRIIDAIKKFFNANNIEVRLADVERLANDYLRQSAERLEQNANRSVNNTNNNKNEEAPHYRTKNGRQLQFNFLSDQEIQDQRDEANNTGTRSDDIQREKDPFENKLGRLKPGEFSHVERVFTEKAYFDFTGSDKIETVEDVVSIFDKLEDSAVENSFVVYEKNGRATVQHLGMGGFSEAQVNVPAMVEGARRIVPDKIYFVHNHPTGTLIASKPDTVIYKALKDIFGDKLQDGIIINLKTGKYGIFNDNISESRNKTDKKGDVPVRVFSFDKIVFDKNHYPENLAKLQSPSDVASFISGHRLGERDKMNFLVLDRQLRVVANFFTDEVEVNTTNAQELVKDMLAKAITHGGEGVIVYGRFKTWGLTGLRTLGNLIKAKSGGNVNLIEAITIKEGDTYESAAEEGVLEAETKYTAESKPMSKSDHENILFRTIQDKNKLVALHNISADNLIKASRIGGFSMPSIAITKPEISFQQYGEITLIGNKDMIDPKIRANKVYGTDAYTTRYPSISYEAKNTKPIKDIVSKMPVSNSIVNELVYDINKDGDAYLYENRNIRLMFAHQKGADIFKTVETDIAKPVIDFVREVEGYDHLSIRDNDDVKTKLGKIIADNLSDKHKKIYERVGLLENGTASEKLINDTFDAAKEYIRKEGQVDVYQAYINAREYITNNNLEGEIKRFARDLYEQLDVTERIFKGYTKNGTPRYVPHTLENVLKEMKSNKGVGIEGLGGSFGQLRAKLVPEFKSIKGIKDKAHKLADNRASEEEYNKVLEQYYEISGKLEKYHKWGDDWLDTRRSFNDEIVSLVRNGESESFKNLPKDLQEEIKTFAANVENIPTDYFEAKPERAIALSEFNSAVVPEGTDQKVIDLLNNSGVEVHRYADNNRMEVIQDVSRKNDLMFRAVGEIGASRALEQSNQKLPATINIDGVERSTTNSEGKPIAQTEEGVRNFWKWFGDSKVVDNEGRPLVVYHGTNADFNTFDKDKIGKNHYQSSDGQGGGGFFFVDKKHNASHGKGLKTLYLKLEDPYMINGFEDYYYAVDNFDANHLDIYDTARERKNDGVIMMSKDGGLFVAFNPNQIKSVDNTGAFYPNSSDIRFRHEDSKDVTLFKYGEGGTKGVFKDSKGNLYKSLTRQENVYDNETKSFGKRDVPGETNEYEILKELQDNRNIVKVRNKVDTKQGPMFEMETLNEVDKLTYNEYNEIKDILEGINNQGYFVNDFVTVMRRPETNELVIVDFSSGIKNKSLIGNPNYDDRRNMSRLKDLLTKEDKEKVEIDDHNENERKLAKYFPGYEPDIRFRTVDESGFYSTVESALEGIKQDKGTPQQFKAMLLKNGAKQAELDWMDYDGSFTDKSVTKDEIQEWIDQNRIEVEDVQKGGFEWKGNDLIVGGEVVANLIHNEDGTWSYQSDFSEGEEVWETKFDAQKEAEEAIIGDPYSPNATKYSQYTLPGGENYKELLLTMPKDKGLLWRQNKAGLWAYFVGDKQVSDGVPDNTYKEIARKTINSRDILESQNADFKSSHFSASNILAHVRFNERTIRVDNPDYKENYIPDFDKEYELIDNGDSYQVKRKSESTPFVNSYSKKILADNNIGIQELKTYLMEKTELGKTHPDAISNKRKRFKTEKVLFIEEIQSDWAQKGKREGFKGTIKELPDNYGVANMGENVYIVDMNNPGGYISKGKSYDEAKANALEILNNKPTAVPDMPFKKTDQWVNLALRRMMMYAAENGYDRIAWTTGQQQADRYDLSKTIEYIEYFQREDGTYELSMPIEFPMPYNMREAELEEYFGKEIASKITNGEGEVVSEALNQKRLSGVDLKVGGEGMHAFYDRIVPKAAGKLGKPFGANVEVVELPGTGQQLSIPVTEKMKESVQEGMPLFRTIGEQSHDDGRAKKADDLFDNIDNLKSVIKDYSKFLGDVFDGAQDKSGILAEAKEKGFDKLGEVIEEYLSNVEDPTELNRVKELLGVDMPDNALRYMLWRNANPNDGSVVWKAKDAVKTSELDDNILFRSGKDFSKAKLNEYESRVRSRHNRGFRSLMYGIEEGWFDRMVSLRILQEAITGKKTFNDKENAYMYENQLSSRNTADIRYYTKKIVDPLLKQVQVVFGKDLSAADDYMNAKHGLERNKYMAREEAERKHTKQKEELNQLLEDGLISEDDYDIQMEVVNVSIDELTEKLIETKDYSGLTALAEERGREDFTQNAMDMVMEVEGRTSKEDIDALWEHVNNATKWIIQKQYDSGMMSKDTYEKINTMYEYYVPLRGFSELTATDIYDYMLNPPSIFEGTLKKAYGRTSKAESPISTILTMGESGIMQANRNRMKQAFYRLVATNPSNYASIEDVWYVKSGNDWQERYPEISPTATAEETIEAIAEFNNEMAELAAEGKAVQGRAKLDVGVKILKAQAPEHIVKVYIAGEEKLIFINGNPRAAQAINGLLQKDLLKKDNLRHGVEYWSRQMSANFTSRNPAFMVTNLMRDVQFAVVSAAVKEGISYSANLSKNVLKVGKTIYANVFGDGNKKNAEYQKYWEEFEANGGETGYANLNSIDYHRKYVNKKLREFSDQRDFLKPFRAWVSFMENGNRVIEDISRFATYVTSRQYGRSIERSVSDAKEITINFNRKGSGGFGANIAHSFYLFSNPALQSMRLLGMMAKNHPVRFTAMLSSTMAAGFMVPMINELLLELFGDDDDKEAYQNITPWVRRNNLVMYVPGTKDKFVTLMLPHELRAFYGIGEMAYEKANGGLRHENIMLETAKQMTAMMPIDPMGGSDWWVPDALKPPYQSYISNQNFMGSPIYRDTPWNKLDPEWTKAYKRTPEFLVEAAKGASDMTGGDDVVPGWANANPARAYHIFSGYLGGYMTTYTDLSMIAFNLLTGRDVRANDIPVVNKLIRTSDEDTKDMRINSEYFYYVDWIKEYEHRLKGYEKRLSDPKYAEKYRDIVTDDEMQMYNYAKGQMQMIKNTQEFDEELSREQKEEFVRRMWEYEDRLKD